VDEDKYRGEPFDFDEGQIRWGGMIDVHAA
jgi:hypothetical protein